MNLKHLFYAAILLSSSMLNAQKWVMVWQDEFSEDGAVDKNLWSHETGGSGFGNQEAQFYTDSTSNSYVSNGNLVIKAKKETIGSNEYSSAKLVSKNMGDWKYGKFEIRAKLPTGKGMWPAIWMLPKESVYGAWPKSGEIDIVENVGFEPDIIHWNTHTESFNHTLGTNKGDKATFTSPTPSEDFHVYATEWYEDKIEFFVDGVEYFQFDKLAGGYKSWPFDQEFYLILNIAVGGSWGGLQGIDNAIFPQEMLIDYVRVYENIAVANQYTLNYSAENGGTLTSTSNNGLVDAGSSVTLTAVPNQGYEFKGWVGTFDQIKNPITFKMDLPVTMKAKFSRIGEKLLNPTFSQGLTSWQTNNGGKSTISASNSELKVSINAQATNAWDIQVSQSPFTLSKTCTYRYSVTALSSVNTTFGTGVGINEDPWSSYANRTIQLVAGVEKTTIADFTMTRTSSNSRVYFDLGKASVGDIVFKEISLIESCPVTGINNSQNITKVTIYPNPAFDLIHLSEASEWQLLNAFGQIINSGKGDKISISEHKAGVYFVKTGTQISKIVKE